MQIRLVVMLIVSSSNANDANDGSWQFFYHKSFLSSLYSFCLKLIFYMPHLKNKS